MTKFITLVLICLCTLGKTNAQQYQPVGDKSTVKFNIKNFGVTTGGSFTGLEGDIQFDKSSPEKAVFNMSIDASKVNTDNDSRDGHLRKAEYFDVANFPKITFKSDKVESKGGSFIVTGQLTLKGTTKSISIPFKADAKDDGYLFEGSFQIDRRDFKVGGSSMVLGDNVTVSLSVFAKKK